MKVTITIEDDPIDGAPKIRFTFDPPITKADLESGDVTPATEIGWSLLEAMAGEDGGRITAIDGEPVE